MDFISFTYPGLEGILKQEVLNRKFNLLEIGPGFVKFSGDVSTMIKANLWLRSANKVYLILAESEAVNFDELFNLVYSIDWKSLGVGNFNFFIKPHLVNSTLKSLKSVQKIVHKAILGKLGKLNNLNGPKLEIRVDIFKNKALILLDTSGDPLYKRGYKQGSSPASIKETLAAGILQLIGCKDEGFIDPFCGSGTILIEKALMDLKIAPGIFRNFLFEKFDWVDKNLVDKERRRAKTRQKLKKLNLIGYDIDENVLKIAENNIVSAGLKNFIKLEKKDFLHNQIINSFVTNPPYGKRIGGKLDLIYKKLKEDLQNVKCGGFITSYKLSDEYFKLFKVRKLTNGGEWVNLFYKN